LKNIETNQLIDSLTDIPRLENTAIITGAIVKKLLPRGVYAPGSNYNTQTRRNFAIFNSSLFINGINSKPEIQVKNKLVPFSEYTPYPKVFDMIGLTMQ
jgi:apolipoprotein N-acyltransferase